MTNDEFRQKLLELCNQKSLSIFERNVVAITSSAAALSKMLLEIESLKEYSVDISQEDIAYLNIISKSGTLYKEPKEEVQKQIKDFESIYELYPALFIYGLGNGVFIKSLLENSNHKTIIVFEPEIEILYIVLNFIDFSKDLFENRLVFAQNELCSSVNYRSLVELKGVVESAKIFNLYINIPFYNAFSDDFSQVNEGFVSAFIQKMKEFGNDATDSLTGINQTLAHILAMLGGTPLSSIINQRKGKTKSAIIVSSGPSLNKQLPLLKKIEDKATIICADSSYAILKKHGIKPDFVTSIEREARTSETFNSPVSDFDDNIIFMCATLTHDNTIEYLNGRKIALTFRPLTFERGFKDDDFGYIGSYMSCAHLAFELAQRLEHEKIIFIGQDLAYGDDMSTHSKDFLYGSVDEEIIKNEKALVGVGLEQFVPAYGGNGMVKTWHIWDLFRKQFEILIRGVKNIEIYNSTEGGARIAGCIEKPFKELVEIILTESKPAFRAPKPFDDKIIKQKLNKYKKFINEILNYGKNLQKEIEALFLELTSILENKNYDKLKEILSKIDKIDKKLESKEFENSYYHVTVSLIENSKIEFTKIMSNATKNDEEEQRKMLEMANARKNWLFALAGMINATRENIINSSKEWFKK